MKNEKRERGCFHNHPSPYPPIYYTPQWGAYLATNLCILNNYYFGESTMTRLLLYIYTLHFLYNEDNIKLHLPR